MVKKQRNYSSSKNFPQQTHFIGVLASEDITRTLEDCRRYMREVYGCRAGQATPIHVTLIPPFFLPEEYTTEDLACAIDDAILIKDLGFTAHIKNFDAFSDRTLFAKVLTDEKWDTLRDAVYSSVLKAVPHCIKKDTRPFIPHLTVANRDVPFGVITKALQVMNELQVEEDFPVDNITIFERQGTKWVDAVSLAL
mgnify:CR=1 FL=1